MGFFSHLAHSLKRKVEHVYNDVEDHLVEPVTKFAKKEIKYIPKEAHIAYKRVQNADRRLLESAEHFNAGALGSINQATHYVGHEFSEAKRAGRRIYRAARHFPLKTLHDVKLGFKNVKKEGHYITGEIKGLGESVEHDITGNAKKALDDVESFGKKVKSGVLSTEHKIEHAGKSIYNKAKDEVHHIEHTASNVFHKAESLLEGAGLAAVVIGGTIFYFYVTKD